MTEDQIEIGRIYEYKTGKRVAPVKITDRIPGRCFMAYNLDSDREITININQLSRVIQLIEKLDEWRLHNGD